MLPQVQGLDPFPARTVQTARGHHQQVLQGHAPGSAETHEPSQTKVPGAMQSLHNPSAKKKFQSDLPPSLASLGDDLLSSAGSQRDEAKRQAHDLVRT